MRLKLKAMILAMCICVVSAADAQQQKCSTAGASVQLLGSGGPITDDARASSGMVIWIDGKSRILIDAGGGVYLRFGQAGARLEDLKLIAISHFHTDHSADLPAILKGAYFMSSPSEIKLIGPNGNQNFPSMTGFYDAMFSNRKGAFGYLSGLRDASDGLMLTMHPENTDTTSSARALVYQDDAIRVYAFGIPHGDVPCLAFRIETPKGTIVVSADQNGSRQEFIEFARDADILVMPAAIDEDVDAQSKFLHAQPSVVGKIASAANAKMLVLDHFMGRSLVNKDKNIEIIKKYYSGPVFAGRDLSCFPLGL